ncbi:MAG: hypothetical protein GWO24_17670, partial [Akkermansiaceae bacterium]|nr:hypothetical protein [Akkermansiaceae bacterium]
NAVSRDGQEWISASELPELKMDWNVTLKSGVSHGPLNLLCIPALYRRGIVNEEAVLENRKTGKKMDAALLLRGLHNKEDDSPRSVKTGKIGPRLPHGVAARPISAKLAVPAGVDAKGLKEFSAALPEICNDLADLSREVSELRTLAVPAEDESIEAAEVPREDAPSVIAALIQQDLAAWADDAASRVLSAGQGRSADEADKT